MRFEWTSSATPPVAVSPPPLPETPAGSPQAGGHYYFHPFEDAQVSLARRLLYVMQGAKLGAGYSGDKGVGNFPLLIYQSASLLKGMKTVGFCGAWEN
ncbi:MAG: hypothetical protein D6691_09150 [Candidatus Hydrogenedentota bacterium]|nr:MAG: hypothetical protein D6691_09150 [Candidatus Hydrogenedentota bacterium]